MKDVLKLIFDGAGLIIFLMIIVLIGRLILDWVQAFARDWKPRGVMLVVAEAIYTITDPPLRALRKVLPPLRIGGMSIDLAFIVLMLLLWALDVFLIALARWLGLS